MKIFIISPPAPSHISAQTGLVHYLVNDPSQKNEVFYFSQIEFQHTIEAAGAKFVPLLHEPYVPMTDLWFFDMFILVFSQGDACLNYLVEQFEKEKPDLIIVDSAFLMGKYFLELIENRYRDKKTSTRPPPSLLFSATLPLIFNLTFEESLIWKLVTPQWTGSFKFRAFLKMIWGYIVQVGFCWRTGLKRTDPGS